MERYSIYRQQIKYLHSMKQLLILSLLLFSMGSSAQSHHIASIGAGIGSSDIYSVELSEHYMFNPYIGLGGTIGFYKEWYNSRPGGEINSGKYNSWYMDEDDKEISKFFLEPQVVVNTPKLFSIGKSNFCMEADLGCIMQIPHEIVGINYINSITNLNDHKIVSHSGGKWAFWDTRVMLKADFRRIMVSLGYSLSNLDIYSTRRKLQVEDTKLDFFYPKKQLNQMLFLRVGYKL